MSAVFFSWYDGWQTPAAQELYTRLETAGFAVDHSPASPHSGREDQRWSDWYSVGLPGAIALSDIFIAVITPSCAGSSWMAEEYHQATMRFLEIGKPLLYYVRFICPKDKIDYQSYFLEQATELPEIPFQAAEIIINSGNQFQ